VIVGAICARGGSKGVPRKNIRPLAGLPLIVWSIRCARAATCLDRVVVSTDDEEIAEVASRYGAEVPFIRPAQLAEDGSSKWEVFQHLLMQLETAGGLAVDILADLDVGCPLRAAADIDACVDILRDERVDVATTAYEAERNPYFNMVEIGSDGVAHVVRQLDPPVTNRQAAPRVYSLSPSVFAIRRCALTEHGHWSQAALRIHVVPRERGLDIDSELDFRFAEFLMAGKRAEL